MLMIMMIMTIIIIIMIMVIVIVIIITFFNDSDFKILKNLKREKNIIISRPDKGRGVVIMDRTDYINKMDHILNDRSNFSKIHHSDPFKNNLLLEDKLNRFLRKLLEKNCLNENEYKQLYSSGSNPGIMYGLPKVHKPNVPLRPVLSSFKTHNYNLAKFLIPFIDQHAKNEFTLRNSYEFFNDLKTIRLDEESYIVSLDITSLYTNVPLKETIEILTTLIYDQNNESFRNCSKREFQTLLELTTMDTFFFFNNTYYKQIDGLAMGSPMSATLANVFLCHHENNWINNCPGDFKPLYYKRYVDDTFAIFRNRQQAERFLDYMNSRHEKISFTMETEENSQIPFLDLLIKKSNNKIETSIYRKPTYTGLGINFISSCYENFKLNAFNTMFYRAFRLTTSYENFHNEIKFLENFFSQNGFIPSIFQKKLRAFLNSIFCPSPQKYGPPKLNIYIRIPYFNDSTNKFFNMEINKILQKYFPQIKPTIVFYNNNKLKNYTNHKETLPTFFESMVVYQFNCPVCQLAYIGSTKKAIFSRHHDHKGTSSRTGRTLSSPLYSRIREHCDNNCKCIFSMDNFNILFKGSYEKQIRIAESILIKSKNPLLNQDSASFPLKLT